MIRTEQQTSASDEILHRLLVDVDAWPLWSPHVASVEAATNTVHDEWVGRTRAFFSPVSTEMVVDEVRPRGGYRWHSTLGPWRLSYDNAVTPEPGGSRIVFEARLGGPGADVLERLVAPVSALGQRRRIRRLAFLAEFLHGSRPNPTAGSPADPSTSASP